MLLCSVLAVSPGLHRQPAGFHALLLRIYCGCRNLLILRVCNREMWLPQHSSRAPLSM
jgi:hypothetical protein